MGFKVDADGLAPDADRTAPGEPPLPSTSPSTAPAAAPAAAAEDQTDPGWPPGGVAAKVADGGTDPGVDAMLEAFDRPPRPPAPQPNLRPSSDGAEFAAHYAGPRDVHAPQAMTSAHDPVILAHLASLATADASVALPVVAATRSADQDTVIRKPKIRKKPAFAIALATCGVVAALAVLIALQWPDFKPPVTAVTVATDPATAVAPSSRAAVSTSGEPSASARVGGVVAVTDARATSAAPSSVSVRSLPSSPPPGVRRTMVAPSRAPNLDQGVPGPARPAHETPNPTF